MNRYDIIGDIHGHADELHELLETLGYRDKEGVLRHSAGRKVIFLGDYIDRGPRIRAVLETVRAMVDFGEALAILGNHEINAMRYHAVGSDGEFLRPHNDTNTQQHRATLDQFPDRAEWAKWINWFEGLPLSLELNGLRAVHACWDAKAIRQLAKISRWEGATLASHSRKGTPDYETISQIINGPETLLPEGFLHKTADGTQRSHIRVKWWLDLAGASAREALFPEPLTPEARQLIPDLPPQDIPFTSRYPEEAPPTFFGHYALKKSIPERILPNLACLDYGTGKGGFLCAYRWDGETTIDPQKFAFIRQGES